MQPLLTSQIAFGLLGAGALLVSLQTTDVVQYPTLSTIVPCVQLVKTAVLLTKGIFPCELLILVEVGAVKSAVTTAPVAPSLTWIKKYLPGNKLTPDGIVASIDHVEFPCVGYWIEYPSRGWDNDVVLKIPIKP